MGINVQTTDIDINTMAGNAGPNVITGSLDVQGTFTVDGSPVSGSAAWGAITGTLSNQTDLNTALGLKAPAASPSLSGTITLANATKISGDLGTFANRPYFQTNTGSITYLEVHGGDTSTSAQANLILRNTSDPANTNVMGVEARDDTNAPNFITWGKRTGGTNVNPTTSLTFGGVVSGIYATINPGHSAAATSDVVRLSDLQSYVLPPTIIDSLPTGTVVGQLLSVTDANGGVGTVTFWNGSVWIDVKTGVTVVA